MRKTTQRSKYENGMTHPKALIHGRFFPVVTLLSKNDAFAETSVRVESMPIWRTQGSSFLATLGFEPESLWDSSQHLWFERCV
jgi:hypothetical protein